MPVAFELSFRGIFIAILCVLGVLLNGCGLSDSRIEWRDGSYVLVWIDDPESVTLSVDEGHGRLNVIVAEQVFAVGASARHVVAKQHPGKDRLLTRYFIVERSNESLPARPANVIGPMSESEFRVKSLELSLPTFSRELESLR